MIRLRRPAIVLSAVVAASALSACAYNEALGRNQFLLVDNAALSQQSTAAWREAVAKPGVMTTGAQVDRIRRVGDRLVQAAGLGTGPGTMRSLPRPAPTPSSCRPVRSG